MNLASQQRDWEELGGEDPFWAILSDSSKRGGRWSIEEFFSAGELEVRELMAWTLELGRPEHRRQALDFGCGVGRDTRAMASRFETVVGVDVSRPMIDKARLLNGHLANCEFVLNETADLARFPNAGFDLVYTNIVLQHMLSTSLIEAYIREFVRVLSPNGLLVFQVPATIPWRYRLQPRRHLYRIMRAFHVPPGTLMNRFKLYPISMRAMPVSRVTSLLVDEGATLLSTKVTRAELGIDSVIYAATRT